MQVFFGSSTMEYNIQHQIPFFLTRKNISFPILAEGFVLNITLGVVLWSLHGKGNMLADCTA